jgi:hypothetical protein
MKGKGKKPTHIELRHLTGCDVLTIMWSVAVEVSNPLDNFSTSWLLLFT